MKEITNLKDAIRVLKSGKALQGLMINLSGCEIGVVGAYSLAEVLESGQCPRGLQINLTGTNIGSKGIKAIAQALKSGKCPQDLELTLIYPSCVWIDKSESGAIAEALASRKCPQGLRLILNSGIDFEAIIRTLASGACPQGLRLEFYGGGIGDDGAKLIAKALMSKKCPQGLQLGLRNSGISDEGAKALAEALETSNCPHGLKIDLSQNPISSDGAIAFAKALKSRKCPPGLYINLANFFIYKEVNETSKNALQSAIKAIKGAKFDRFKITLPEIKNNKTKSNSKKFDSNAQDESSEKKSSLLENKSQNSPKSLKTRKNSPNPPLYNEEKIIRNLEEAIQILKSDNCPTNLKIDLVDSEIGNKGAKLIAQTLSSKKCPAGLQINLWGNDIGAEGAKAIAQALSSDKCPAGLQINLANNDFEDKLKKRIAQEFDLKYDHLGGGNKAIAQALGSGNCPPGLQINLEDNNLGVGGTKAIAQALDSGKCPTGLQIKLGYNNLGVEGAKAIAQALQNGNCPTGLQIDLQYNHIGDEGAEAIAWALASGKCPTGLQINLKGNHIGTKGANLIAKALCSDKCPRGLQINLSNNRIGDNGVKAIAQALGSNKCPQELKINLRENGIGAEGDKAIGQALSSGKCPTGLQVNLGWRASIDIDDKGVKAIQEAIKNIPGAKFDHFKITLPSIKNDKTKSGSKKIDSNVQNESSEKKSLFLESKSRNTSNSLKTKKSSPNPPVYNREKIIKNLNEAIRVLKNGRAPQGLTIDLSSSYISDVGAQALFEAFQSGKAPQGLTINWGWNEIGNAGIQALTKTLQSGNCPAGLQIDFSWNSIGSERTNVVKEAIKNIVGAKLVNGKIIFAWTNNPDKNTKNNSQRSRNTSIQSTSTSIIDLVSSGVSSFTSYVSSYWNTQQPIQQNKPSPIDKNSNNDESETKQHHPNKVMISVDHQNAENLRMILRNPDLLDKIKHLTQNPQAIKKLHSLLTEIPKIEDQQLILNLLDEYKRQTEAIKQRTQSIEKNLSIDSKTQADLAHIQQDERLSAFHIMLEQELLSTCLAAITLRSNKVKLNDSLKQIFYKGISTLSTQIPLMGLAGSAAAHLAYFHEEYKGKVSMTHIAEAFGCDTECMRKTITRFAVQLTLTKANQIPALVPIEDETGAKEESNDRVKEKKLAKLSKKAKKLAQSIRELPKKIKKEMSREICRIRMGHQMKFNKTQQFAVDQAAVVITGLMINEIRLTQSSKNIDENVRELMDFAMRGPSKRHSSSVNKIDPEDSSQTSSTRTQAANKKNFSSIMQQLPAELKAKKTMLEKEHTLSTMGANHPHQQNEQKKAQKSDADKPQPHANHMLLKQMSQWHQRNMQRALDKQQNDLKLNQAVRNVRVQRESLARSAKKFSNKKQSINYFERYFGLLVVELLLKSYGLQTGAAQRIKENVQASEKFDRLEDLRKTGLVGKSVQSAHQQFFRTVQTEQEQKHHSSMTKNCYIEITRQFTKQTPLNSNMEYVISQGNTMYVLSFDGAANWSLWSINRNSRRKLKLEEKLRQSLIGKTDKNINKQTVAPIVSRLYTEITTVWISLTHTIVLHILRLLEKSAIEQIHYAKKKQKRNAKSSTTTGNSKLTPDEIINTVRHIALKFAKTITKRYQSPLQQLQLKGCCQLARTGILRITSYLKDNRIATTICETHALEALLLSGFIHGTSVNAPLAMNHSNSNERQDWYVNDFIEHIGIQTSNNHFYVAPGIGSLYGFRLGTEQEALELGFQLFEQASGQKNSIIEDCSQLDDIELDSELQEPVTLKTTPLLNLIEQVQQQVINPYEEKNPLTLSRAPFWTRTKHYVANGGHGEKGRQRCLQLKNLLHHIKIKQHELPFGHDHVSEILRDNLVNHLWSLLDSAPGQKMPWKIKCFLESQLNLDASDDNSEIAFEKTNENKPSFKVTKEDKSKIKNKLQAYGFLKNPEISTWQNPLYAAVSVMRF